MPLGMPSTAHEATEQFGRIPMRDTEPFTTSRVQVRGLAPPVQPAARITFYPEVKSVRSGANIDKSDAASSTHFFSLHAV